VGSAGLAHATGIPGPRTLDGGVYGPQVRVTSIAEDAPAVEVCSAAMSVWPQVARCVLGFLRTRLGLPSMGRASRGVIRSDVPSCEALLLNGEHGLPFFP
jgi:hypothetical protein